MRLNWDVALDADHNDFITDSVYSTYDGHSTVELEHARSWLEQELRAHWSQSSFNHLRIVSDVLLRREAQTLCESCLDRRGCDMCIPFDPYDFASAFMTSDDADHHFERYGRPAFPNEY